MRLRGLSLVFLLVFVGSASADDKTEKQKRADQLFEEGRNLLSAGDQNAAAACKKFDEAIALDPEAPGTMLNLGLCNEKLSKFKTALYWFRRAQARAAETNLPDYEAAAKQHTVDLAGKVATIKIQFSTTPPEGTKVKIDNQDIPPADYLNAEVDPGPHTLVAGAPGYKIFTHEFTVQGRGGDTLDIELVAGDNSVVVDRGAGRRKIAIITALGGGVLMGVSGLLAGVIWDNRYEACAAGMMLLEGDARKDCKYPALDPAMASAAEIQAQDKKAVEYANHQRYLAKWYGTGMFIGGVAAIGVAAAIYFTAPEKERIDRTVFSPVVGSDQVGFALSGRY